MKNLDRTLTELQTAQAIVERTKLRIIGLVRDKVEQCIREYDWQNKYYYFRPEDFTVELHKKDSESSMSIIVDTLRFKDKEGNERRVYEECLDEHPPWLENFQTKLTDALGLKRHKVEVFIYPGLMHK